MQGTAAPLPSGALSHAFIQHPPLRFDPQGASGLMYDDGNKLLIIPFPNKILVWSVNQKGSPNAATAGNPSVMQIAEGPVLLVRFSLDETILAIQRSSQEVEFLNTKTGAVFRQACKQGTDHLFGLFWTDCPSCDVVFVTSSGLELYNLSSKKDGLKLTDVKKQNVSWYVYTHDSRLVLLASGMQCKTLTGYQFAAAGIIRPPKFDVTMAKSEVNSKPVLSSEDMHIATMYGRLYCLQVDRVSMQLHLYRFYRDAVEPQGSLPIYSGHVALSVVDNVLLIHEINSKVVLLYDVKSDSRVPVSAPLTLLVKGIPSGASSNSATDGGNPGGNSSGLSSDADSSSNSITTDVVVYDIGWVFANPNLVLDRARGLLWRLHLDLEAIAASSSDTLPLLAFLQRRSREASKAKLLSMEVIRSMIMERQPLPLIARAMDVISSSYARAVKLAIDSDKFPTGNSAQGSQTPASRFSTAFEVPRQFDVSGAILPDAVVQAVQTTPANREENPVVYVDVEAKKAGWVKGDGSSGEARSASAVNSKAESTSAKGISPGPQQREGQQSGVKVHSKTGNAEIDIVTIVSSHEHSALSGLAGRPLQQNNTEMFVTEFGKTGSGLPVSISPEEMLQGVFNPIEKDMIVDASFVVACIVEYLQSAAAEHIRVSPALHILVIQVLAQQQQYFDLWQLIVGKTIPPSKEVAFQLLEVGAHDTSLRKLGMDMLRQLHFHTDYINLLLQDGRLLEAIRYVRQNEVRIISPTEFLEAAVVWKDPQKLAAVFRFCFESVPNFKGTTAFSTYLPLVRG